VPERQSSGRTGRRTDHHLVDGDLLDAPAGRPEGEDIADPRLVDHLLVEFAHSASGVRAGADLFGAAREVDRIVAAIRDRPAAGGDQLPGAGPCRQHPGGGIAGQPGPQLGELLAGISPAQHVDHRIESCPRQFPIRIGPPDQIEQLIGSPRRTQTDRYQLLRQDIQRIAQPRERLDECLLHALHDGGAFQQIAARGRKEDPAAGRSDAVARPADALQGTRHRPGSLRLDHQVDRPHVDAQFQRGGRHHAGQPSGLQLGLDLQAPLLADRPVVRASDDRHLGRFVVSRTCAGTGGAPGRHVELRIGFALAHRMQLVELGGQSLSQPSRIDEADRRVVSLDKIQNPRDDPRPDRIGDGFTLGADIRVQFGHVVERNLDAELPGLLRRWFDDADRAISGEELGYLPHRIDRGRQADTLWIPAGCGQALEADGQMRATLGGGKGMHLVDDDGLHLAQRLGGRAGQHQEQRFGCGDQDVGRVAQQPTAFTGRRVAGTHSDPHFGLGQAEPTSGGLHTAQRDAQVAFHVDRQGLQRRDVEHPHLAGRRGVRQLVQTVQEGGQRLSGSGGRNHQGVFTGADGPPGRALRRCRAIEGAGEPGAGGLTESSQRVEWHLVVHVAIVDAATDKNSTSIRRQRFTRGLAEHLPTARSVGAMREAELWQRLVAQLGSGYARVWAEQVVLADLGGRTVSEALAAGVPCKTIWRAAWAHLELPAHDR